MLQGNEEVSPRLKQKLQQTVPQILSFTKPRVCVCVPQLVLHREYVQDDYPPFVYVDTVHMSAFPPVCRLLISCWLIRIRVAVPPRVVYPLIVPLQRESRTRAARGACVFVSHRYRSVRAYVRVREKTDLTACVHTRDSQHSVCVCVCTRPQCGFFFFFFFITSQLPRLPSVQRLKKTRRSSMCPSLLLAITKQKLYVLHLLRLRSALVFWVQLNKTERRVNSKAVTEQNIKFS